MIFEIKSHGKLNKIMSNLEQILRYNPKAVLENYGRIGVEYLKAATPVDTGLTANSWNFYVEKTPDVIGQYRITWYNSNVKDGCNIALMLQYGHGTKNGTYVTGIDYINPALAPVYEGLYDTIYKEVMK